MGERTQEIRILEMEYLKLKWKIKKYETYLKTFGVDRGALFRDRINQKILKLKHNHGRLWDMLVEIHKEV